MNTITIPRNLVKNDDLVVLPRKRYMEFLGFEKMIEKKSAEEADTDLAIRTYKQEKQQGKLKTIRSLADMG